MLLGRPPFWGRDAADVMQKHIHAAPVPIRDVSPTVPKAFADAIMRCLAQDPWARFPTAMELRGALDAVTFFGAPGETAGREASSGVAGAVVALIAGVALLVGLLAGLALR